MLSCFQNSAQLIIKLRRRTFGQQPGPALILSIGNAGEKYKHFVAYGVERGGESAF